MKQGEQYDKRRIKNKVITREKSRVYNRNRLKYVSNVESENVSNSRPVDLHANKESRRPQGNSR